MYPLFFVSVASKGLSQAVSLLFATLARRRVSVAVKGLMEAKYWRESSGSRWKDFGGVRRNTWPIEALGKRASMGCDSFRPGRDLRPATDMGLRCGRGTERRAGKVKTRRESNSIYTGQNSRKLNDCQVIFWISFERDCKTLKCLQ